ncbi:MAG: coiled-coil domain-containing protein, partial [Bacteroidota bacterium]
TNNALTVIVYEAEYDEVEKEWKKTIKDYKSEKVELSKHSFFADNVAIKEMGTGTIDIYTNFAYKKEDKSTRMVVACDLGVGYLNSKDYKDKFEIIKKILYDFAVKLTKDAVGEQLKTVNKALDKLKDKQSDLEKDKKDMDENIVNDKAKIKKAEEDIKKNEIEITKNLKEQEAQKKLIDDQQKIVDEVKKKLDSVR